MAEETIDLTDQAKEIKTRRESQSEKVIIDGKG